MVSAAGDIAQQFSAGTPTEPVSAYATGEDGNAAQDHQYLSWLALIVSMNPTWKDLAEDWFPELQEQKKKQMHRSFDSLRMTPRKGLPP